MTSLTESDPKATSTSPFEMFPGPASHLVHQLSSGVTVTNTNRNPMQASARTIQRYAVRMLSPSAGAVPRCACGAFRDAQTDTHPAMYPAPDCPGEWESRAALR